MKQCLLVKVLLLLALRPARIRATLLLLEEPLHSMSTTRIDPRTVLVAGGCVTVGNQTKNVCSNVTDRAYLLNLDESIQTPIPNLPRPRYRHAAVLDGHHRVWLIGGLDANHEGVVEMDVFDTRSLLWNTDLHNITLSKSLFDHTAVYVASTQHIYILGGVEVSVHGDSATNAVTIWTVPPPTNGWIDSSDDSLSWTDGQRAEVIVLSVIVALVAVCCCCVLGGVCRKATT